MRKILPLVICLALASSAPAQKNRPAGKPGEFDYYVLSLSWSPGFCAQKPSNPQCAPGRAFSFVVHGLWPQYQKARNGKWWPEFCSDAAGLAKPETMLDIMPDKNLIRHEWEKHGTCAGPGAEEYFKLTRKAFQSVKIPKRFQAPKNFQTLNAAAIEKEFTQANPGLTGEKMEVTCSANYLSEVRICLDKDLKPIPCTNARDCKNSAMRLPPVR